MKEEIKKAAIEYARRSWGYAIDGSDVDTQEVEDAAKSFIAGANFATKWNYFPLPKVGQKVIVIFNSGKAISGFYDHDEDEGWFESDYGEIFNIGSVKCWQPINLPSPESKVVDFTCRKCGVKVEVESDNPDETRCEECCDNHQYVHAPDIKQYTCMYCCKIFDTGFNKERGFFNKKRGLK